MKAQTSKLRGIVLFLPVASLFILQYDEASLVFIRMMDGFLPQAL